MFCVQVFTHLIFNPIPLQAELLHGWRRSNSWSPTRGGRGNPPAHAHPFKLSWRLPRSTPERFGCVQKRTPNTKKKHMNNASSQTPTVYDHWFFSYAKAFLKIHVTGVWSSSPHHRLRFSLSVPENVFQRLSLVLVSNKHSRLHQNQSSPDEKIIHLFHLPQWFSGCWSYNSRSQKKLRRLPKKTFKRWSPTQILLRIHVSIQNPNPISFADLFLTGKHIPQKIPPFSHRDDLHIGSTSPTTQSHQGTGLRQGVGAEGRAVFEWSKKWWGKKGGCFWWVGNLYLLLLYI